MANYLKQGREDVFIENNAEIEYAKFNNLRHSVMGFMLGDFDEHGVYTIDEEIVKELISLRKYIVDVIDNMQICHSVIKLNGHLTFLVSYEEDCATLSLLEKVNHEGNFKENAGSVSDINEYILDRVETSGVIDRTYFYRRWNITEFEEPALNIHDLDEESQLALFGLVNRFKYLLYTNTLFLEHEKELEMEELAYGAEVKALLAKYPKLKKAVDDSVKEKLADKKDLLCVDKPFVAQAITEVIEQTIEENLDVLKKEELETFKAEKQEIQEKHNQKMNAIIPHTVEKPATNAENSVGIIKVDTSKIQSRTLAKLVEPQTEEAAAESEQPVKKPITEQDFTLAQLQETKNANRQQAVADARDGYIRFALSGAIDDMNGGPKIEEQNSVDPAQARLFAIKKIAGDEVLKRNVTPDTKKKVESGTTAKTGTSKPSLVGQAAAAKPKTNAKTAAKAPATAGKTGGKAAGGGGSGGGKSGGGKKSNKKKTTAATNTSRTNSGTTTPKRRTPPMSSSYAGTQATSTAGTPAATPSRPAAEPSTPIVKRNPPKTASMLSSRKRRRKLLSDEARLAAEEAGRTDPIKAAKTSDVGLVAPSSDASPKLEAAPVATPLPLLKKGKGVDLGLDKGENILSAGGVSHDDGGLGIG